VPASRVASDKSKDTKRVRPRRDFDGLEQRRMRAAEMFRRGKTQAEVASALGVSRTAAWNWYWEWHEGGKKALQGAGRAGRRPQLSDQQLEDVGQALLKGARANGFPTDLWTVARVAEVIEAVTGIAYSESGVWRILRQRMNWSRQRPARRALERDDEAIVRWMKKDWPRIKKAPGAGAPG
jgi:transposase